MGRLPTTVRPSPARAAGRWVGRVLAHGAVAGGGHGATVFAAGWAVVLVGLADHPSGGLPLRDHLSMLLLLALTGAAAGLATAVAVGPLTAPAAAAEAVWARPWVRTAVWAGPAVLWLVVSPLVAGVQGGPTMVWFLHVGPAVWMAVAMRRLAGRWDPADAARPRPPLPRREPMPGLYPK